jgi:hypothetical protein
MVQHLLSRCEVLYSICSANLPPKKINKNNNNKKSDMNQALVAHAYNPIYSGSRDQEALSLDK